MPAKSPQMHHELLDIGFRATPRGLLNGLVFATLTAVLVWPRLPHAFVVAWLTAFASLAFLRLRIAKAFLAEPAPVPDPDRWALRAAFGYGGTGLAWGVLGSASMLMAPEVPLYMMWVIFLVALFSVLAAQTTGSHPWIFRAFVLSAMGPILATGALTPAPNYWLRLAAGFMTLGIALAVGRAGNRYVVDSIAMRFENLELLREAQSQKAQLDRANEAKTRFLAAASHDLRQPMQALVLLVENLREREADLANRRITESIHATVDSMSALLNEILDISRLDAGTVAPRTSSFRVSDVLDRLRAAYTFPASRKELAFRVRSCDAVVKTDPVLLYRVLVNLTENALRYTLTGGVLVGCRMREEGLWIEVWDTGMGIPSDQFEAIFQEFRQLGNPQRDREQGFGLGLAIVERTARLLELPLQLASRVDRGSVFRLRVPRGDPAQVRLAEVPRPAEALEGCRVVVVEDDAPIRAAMALLLEGWRCEVRVASSGRELDGVLGAMAQAPEVFIVDYRMPGDETGIALLQRMRARFPEAFGILVSGDLAPDVLRAAREAHVELLHKPLRPARLRALLGAARVGQPGMLEAAVREAEQA